MRKQSLYMKFDPLLRDSPKKMPSNSELNGLPLPAAFVTRYFCDSLLCSAQSVFKFKNCLFQMGFDSLGCEEILVPVCTSKLKSISHIGYKAVLLNFHCFYLL